MGNILVLSFWVFQSSLCLSGVGIKLIGPGSLSNLGWTIAFSNKNPNGSASLEIMKEPPKTPSQFSLLLTQGPKASNRVNCQNAVPIFCDCFLRFNLVAAAMITSWMVTVLIIPVTKSVISTFNTGYLLFLPRIFLAPMPSCIKRSSQIIIFTIFSVKTLQSWAFLKLLSSKNVLWRNIVLFLAA